MAFTTLQGDAGTAVDVFACIVHQRLTCPAVLLSVAAPHAVTLTTFG